DRDGHPLITADVTRETLARLHHQMLDILAEHVKRLEDRLTISRHYVQPPAYLMKRIQTCEKALGRRKSERSRQRELEPWRELASLIGERIRRSRNAETGRYTRRAEIAEDLSVLRRSLQEVGAERLADIDVFPVERLVRVFGLHLCALDVRQNSAFHDRALTQLLRVSGMEIDDFAGWAEDERLELLNHEL